MLPLLLQRKKVDILELNKFIQQFQQNIVLQSNGLRQGCLELKPLDCFIPEGINRKACIHIAGDEEVGKTSLGLEFAYRNPDYIFIYVDTYFKLQEKDVPDNVYLFRTNKIEDIINYLNELENRAADYIIIDSISNLLLQIEQGRNVGYVTQRYLAFNNEMIKVIEKCCNLNICLILFNTINGNGVPSNFSSQLKYRCSLDILLLEKVKGENCYWLNIRADKCKTASITADGNTRTILLTGQGGN